MAERVPSDGTFVTNLIPILGHSVIAHGVYAPDVNLVDLATLTLDYPIAGIMK